MNKAEGLIFAQRCHPLANFKGRTPKQREGLAYERKFVSALSDALISAGTSFDLAHNPWFVFEGKMGRAYCVPDLILSIHDGPYKDRTFVIEVKLTYTAEAIEKLENIYCPVVAHALNESAIPVVVCKHGAKIMPHRAWPTFYGAVQSSELEPYPFPIFQWLGAAKLNLGQQAPALENMPLRLSSN
jgi:hypothetical protein